VTNPSKNDAGTTRLPADTPASASVQWLIQVDHRVQTARHALETTVLNRFELSWRGYIVLANAARPHGIDNQTLAATAGVTVATLTGLVDTLTRAGLVTRARNPADLRRMTITATESGRRRLAALCDDIEPVAAALLPGMANLLAGLDDALLQSCHTGPTAPPTARIAPNVPAAGRTRPW
jgi:DNA-binding MarR family transcriptional regulator